MALTTCKECKQQISQSAATCPHCGVQFPALKGAASGVSGLVMLVFGLVALAIGLFGLYWAFKLISLFF